MSLQRDQIAARVRLIVAGHMGRPAICIKYSDRLFEDVGIDWFDLQELIIFVSEVFGVRVADIVPEHICTISDLVDMTQQSRRVKTGKNGER